MFNNLTVVNSDHGYGYESYYLSRKNESVDFPTDAYIASVFGATDYEIKSISLPIDMNVSGTLLSVSSTPVGYLSKIAKHINVLDEVVERGSSLTAETSYDLENVPVAGNFQYFLRGTIYAEDSTAIQTFKIERGSTSVVLEDIGSPSVKVISGSIDENTIELTWNVSEAPANHIVVDYEYESSESTSVLTKFEPIPGLYDLVSVYGSTSISTKYIKIMTNFKCKVNTGYTYVNSKLFYTRCKYKSDLCNSNSGAVVPALVVCNQRLF